jgi:hypothetical protein
VITLQDAKQFIPFIKPLFDGLRSARDLFRRDRQEKPEHSIDIPRKTLILLPEIYPHALCWGLAKVGDRNGMQLTGHLQATNTSKYGIRASGIRLVEPAGVEIFTQIVSIEDPETGVSGPKYLIPAQSIGELHFMFIVIPVTGTPGTTLTSTIAVLDQFGNEHVARNLQLRFIGSQTSP